jgi:hypothetical protein
MFWSEENRSRRDAAAPDGAAGNRLGEKNAKSAWFLAAFLIFRW